MRRMAGASLMLAVWGCAEAVPIATAVGEQTTGAASGKADGVQTSTGPGSPTGPVLTTGISGAATTAVMGTSSSTGTGQADESTTTGFPRLDLGPIPDLGVGGETGDEECFELVATVRDFSVDHPDFETFTGEVASLGLVEDTLGMDGNPVFNDNYAGPQMLASEATFGQWYQDVPGINHTFEVVLPLVEESEGVFSYDSNAFFPVDGVGFGNQGQPNNFHFTTELHADFTYQGGESFTFRGDDDLWLFVDGQLALDLGGLHPALEGTVDMDDLGLTPGVTYAMDIFHAERHTTESNFRIATNIVCFGPPEG
jgi:fibro-slime domain-containing protein